MYVSACRDSIIDLIFVVDGSGSICDSAAKDTTGLRGCANWNLVANFIAEFIRQLQISSAGNRVALVTFSSQARTVFYLDE